MYGYKTYEPEHTAMFKQILDQHIKASEMRHRGFLIIANNVEINLHGWLTQIPYTFCNTISQQ